MGTSKALHTLTRQTTLNLKVISWRVFLHGASREQAEKDHLIEVRCHLEQPLLAGRIIVGTEREDLASLRISIEIRSAQSTPGWLRYNPPISSGDGVVNEKTGSVDGRVFFRKDTLQEISRLLRLQPPPDIRIGVTVSLECETAQMHSNRKWDGKEPLEIDEAVMVVAGATPEITPEPDKNNAATTMLDIVRTIENGIAKLNTRVRDLGVLFAIAFVFILIALWHRH
jgi:hypothetical protein